ncbi:cytochrome c oxidase subunit 3 [Nocardia bovistercoris]|uniref:Cytochrome aa3 subunit 3 n=1 Tax=Nocardia bovistercoris TaxID=2785916 RepID=A0A931MZP0_9NOCA|nr:cytochrome c oxidase subunit 3 [Nocardia bovistercoris]MBH0776360.1 cytochrome c oxidase subunit 3 [Nocardia bovistercoris]
MWVMVLGDLLIFGAYFVIFMVHRSMEPQRFLEAQQHLDLNLGTLNTLVLLTSSWLVARGVRAARTLRYDSAIRFTTAAGALGVVFIAIKALEWSTELRAGHTLPGDEFFSFYYVFTGVHLFHVALGLLILAIVVRELRDPRRRAMATVESGAIYWHMVDLLWIVIFGLLYVMR